MNISPVSFSSTASAGNAAISSFQDKINQPQTYITKEQPSAAANLNGKNEKEKSPLKTLGKIVLAAGVALAALGIGAKKGIFNEGKSELLNKFKAPCKKIGDYVADKAGKLAASIKSRFPAAADEAADDVATATKGAGEKVTAAVSEVADDVATATKGAGEKVTAAVSEVADDAATAVKGAGEKVTAAVSEVADDAATIIQEAGDIIV